MIRYYRTLFVRYITKIISVFIKIKSNRILFYSFSGKEYSCSPKYISEKIINDCRFEVIWAFNDPEKYCHLINKGIKIVKYGSLKHILMQLSARFVVTNTGPFKGVATRKNQEIINTWHGGGAYKKTGMDNPYKDKYTIRYNKDFGQSGVTLFVSSSKFFTKYAINGAFGYNGAVLEVGLPRNDVLFDDNKKNTVFEKLRKYFNISQDDIVILYAPTWRNYSLDKYEKLDIDSVVSAIRNKYQKNVIFIHRGHNLSSNMNITDNSEVINATNYPDMQELLIASDLLISDYSSCIWDFSLLNKPVILFIPDIKLYNAQFSFYTPIEQWGCYLAESNSQFIECVEKMNPELTKEKTEKNHKLFGNAETGNATDEVYRYISSKL